MINSRRNFIGQSTLGIFGLISANSSFDSESKIILPQDSKKLNPHYPSTDPSDISAVVGAAHANFDLVKELVTARPELAKASWDWGYGDVETALGAASHMGRKDIADFLMEHGARADIFTLAMLGKINTVKSMIADMPNIQKIGGPHGFTLMHHAKIRLMRKMLEGDEKKQQEELVEYLNSLGDADTKPTALDISEEEQKTYLGKYTFGKGEDDYFELKLNMRKLLSMSRGDTFGRALLRTGEHTFAPGGAPSVRVVFEVKDKIAQTVAVYDPMLMVKATRI